MGKGDRKPSVFKGEVYKLSCGSTAEVIFYESSFKVLVRLESGLEKWTRADHLKKGNLFDPYHPNTYGVGFLGEGKYSAKASGKLSAAYNHWSGMFSRCYDPIMQNQFPTYIGCSVDKEWHNFQNFAEWFYSNQYYKEGWQLDKDILVPGNKIYSSETCAFIPKVINMTMSRNTLRDFDSIGGQKRKGYGYRCVLRENGKSKCLGTFKTLEEARKVYKEGKLGVIKRLAGNWKDEIDPRVYQSLINWRLDDPNQ